MNPRLIILADDLTGAADSAVPFATRGLRTSVVLSPEAASDAEIVARDTETRAMSLPRAVEETTRIVESLPSEVPVFKKIDSMLRGYVGPECAATLAAYRKRQPQARLLIAPAFPLMGRVTRDGIQFVHGKPVGHVPTILERAGLRTAVVMPHGSWPEDADAWVCDAESGEDLRWIVAASSQHPAVLMVGTAGLACILAEQFSIAPCDAIPRSRGSVLFVVGSVSALARAQVDALSPDVRRAAPSAIAALDGSTDAVVCTPSAEGRELDALVSRTLARQLTPILSRYSALFLTGGSTARAVLDTIGVKELVLLGELEPGVPVSVTNSGLLIVTKAGAFGDAETLERSRRTLKL